MKFEDKKFSEKIKELRQLRHMTQTELAGDQITRNMLSLVENGSALPSIPTVVYLSERLGVPAGMLLARDDEELMYKKIAELPKIKQLYTAGDYRLCCAMCKNLSEDQQDDEICLLLSKCYFNLARETFNLGKLHQSARYFDMACKYCRATIYGEEQILSASAVYFEYMMALSPSIDSESGNEAYKGSGVSVDSFCKYAIVLKSFESGEDCLARKYVESSGDTDKGYIEHIKAKIEMKAGDYRSACERLKKLINSDALDCRVVLYDIFKDLEECCREVEDYKGAYEYSVGKVELLEHMLRDDLI